MAEDHVCASFDKVKQTIKYYCKRTCTAFVVDKSTKGFGDTGSPVPYSVLKRTDTVKNFEITAVRNSQSETFVSKSKSLNFHFYITVPQTYP